MKGLDRVINKPKIPIKMSSQIFDFLGVRQYITKGTRPKYQMFIIEKLDTSNKITTKDNDSSILKISCLIKLRKYFNEIIELDRTAKVTTTIL